MKRYLEKVLLEGLTEKMAFVGGPRQVGKTTMSKQIGLNFYHTEYFNWDALKNKKDFLQGKWSTESEFIILDEFHKYSKWKNWIKGEFDLHRDHLQFLLTGSARLNVYRKGGDSLQGRYHYYRLHPLSFAELENHSLDNYMKPNDELTFSSKFSSSTLFDLLNYGGFPEPFIKQSAKHHRIWKQERIERFFKEDIRELTQLQNLSGIQLLSELLPERAGGVLSLNSLREDLDVSHRAVDNWMNILEEFYYCFRVYPYQSKKYRALKKEPKLYLWDWSEVTNPGARLENLVASHLSKFCNFLWDTEGYVCELFYLRDKDKREVDFLVTIFKKPWFAVEVKQGKEDIHKNLVYFNEKLSIPYCYQVSLNSKEDYKKGNIRVIPLDKFLSGLV
jgi:uncharacterized protein